MKEGKDNTTNWMEKGALSDDEHIKPEALLIGIYMGKDKLPECEEHLTELARLAETFGAEVKERFEIPLRKYDVRTLLTSGKLQEAVDLARSLDVNLIIFDHEITPAQQRNLEKEFGVTVMDRAELILEVFTRHARTKEARIQIDIARIQYQFPRLKRLWTHLSRQKVGGGSGGFLKGEGEKQIEIDRRLLQRRLDQLDKDLKEVVKHREIQRQARSRSDLPIFGIIGYTNAGKSTLLNRLTDAGVLEEDRLFATLDTTTRKYTLPNNQPILLTDTVGFIRKLPHQLVASFRSTLEEAFESDILLHLVDVSDPYCFEHTQASCEVLKSLKGPKRPMVTVLNKIDQCEDQGLITRLRLTYPRTVQISAKTGEGMDRLHEMMMEEVAKMRQIVKLRVPQSEFHIVSQVTREGRIISQEYDANDVVMEVEVPARIVHKLDSYLD